MSPLFALILFCHLACALGPLGLQPFFPQILAGLGAADMPWLTGFAYSLPALCAGLAGPFWGAVADRSGARAMLVRAQLGIFVGLALAACAGTPLAWLAALTLQGLLGGTFAASKAYLAVAGGEALATRLGWMESSARFALIAGPVLVGLVWTSDDPLAVYRYLAPLPLVAAVALLTLGPASTDGVRPAGAERASGENEEVPEQPELFGAQAVLGFSAVLGAPFFIRFCEVMFPSLSKAHAGFLFSLPHVVSLGILLVPVAGLPAPRRALRLGLALMAGGALAHVFALSLPVLVLGRVATGAGLALGIVAINAWSAQAARGRPSGRLFGKLEGLAKLSGVAGGFAAGGLVASAGLFAPYLAAGFVPALYLLVTLRARHRNPLSLTTEMPS